jgi:hypothetical protein
MTLNGSAIAFTSAFEAKQLPGAAAHSPLATRRTTSLKLAGPDPAAKDRLGRLPAQADLFCRRSRWARTRITFSAKNGVFLTMKRNCCS